MDYRTDQLFREIRQLTDRAALVHLILMACAALLTGLLCLAGILPSAALWSLIWIIPAALFLGIITRCQHKKAQVIARKQQISMMAYHAKKVLDSLQQRFPDTFISDCRIKMRCMARHGIDIDAAVERLGDNVQAYNQLALAFLKESDRYEDGLYDLMQPDTLLQYGLQAHKLRVKANELGLIHLTDTAFFHEIEAYAGGLDAIRDNWKKLSSELDEAYEVLNGYIQSIGLGEDPLSDEKGRMTFKTWTAQLQEAFKALEAYDTRQAKKILNGLIGSGIDTDITSTLKGIVANIDEMISDGGR